MTGIQMETLFKVRKFNNLQNNQIVVQCLQKFSYFIVSTLFQAGFVGQIQKTE